MTFKKSFPILALVIFAALALSACGGAEDPADPPQAGEEVTSESAPSSETSQESEDSSSEEESEVAAPEVPRYNPTSPVAEFSEAEIQELGVECQGSPDEIANCIKNWQQQNMLYCQNMDVEDCSDAIRANYALPGLYSSLDLIKEKKQNGKVYGICMDYAVIYCSIAEYYGLECRVVNSITKPSERPGANVPVTTGMAEEEYLRWNEQLKTKGIDYTYDVLRLIARETPEHYWAEVNLNGEWIVLDASNISTGGNTETEYIAKGDFEITDWFASDSSQAAYEYALRIAQGEDLRNEGYDSVGEQFMEGREVAQEYGDVENYEGIVDSLGQEGRSASMDDFMQGYGLMPYLSTCQETCDFLGAPGECYEDCEEENQILACYEECSGDPYYLACIYLEDNDTGDLNLDAYEACCGVALNLSCEETCAGD
jgi:transglutaminase-like putative cysteine protease